MVGWKARIVRGPRGLKDPGDVVLFTVGVAETV